MEALLQKAIQAVRLLPLYDSAIWLWAEEEERGQLLRRSGIRLKGVPTF